VDLERSQPQDQDHGQRQIMNQAPVRLVAAGAVNHDQNRPDPKVLKAAKIVATVTNNVRQRKLRPVLECKTDQYKQNRAKLQGMNDRGNRHHPILQ
jgi:predicted secreted protein